MLEVAATLSTQNKHISLFVINRSKDQTLEAELNLAVGAFAGPAKAYVVNGKDIKSTNTFAAPGEVQTREFSLPTQNSAWVCSFEPHSVTCVVVGIK